MDLVLGQFIIKVSSTYDYITNIPEIIVKSIALAFKPEGKSIAMKQ